jgi:hypothetical protein
MRDDAFLAWLLRVELDAQFFKSNFVAFLFSVAFLLSRNKLDARASFAGTQQGARTAASTRRIYFLSFSLFKFYALRAAPKIFLINATHLTTKSKLHPSDSM